MNKNYRFKICFFALFILSVTHIYAQGVALEWVRHMESIVDGVSAVDITVDQDGNVYTTDKLLGKNRF
jgi:hypothetical protein